MLAPWKKRYDQPRHHIKKQRHYFANKVMGKTWIWVWASSGSWWLTGKPGMLQSMGSQRIRPDWVTKLNWRSWHPITSWQIEGEKVEAVTDFLFLSSKITADGDCNHEIRRRLLLGRKAMTNLDSVLKNKDITLPTKVCIVKAMVFPVVMYRCEN